MSLAFLAPAFLLGLTALAVPVVVHLIHRERKQVVRFPSLMFLQRIPYRTVRRQRIRHWALLLLRCAALVLLAAAFARPFLDRPGAMAAPAGGARAVAILVDRSWSMGYAGRWDEAKAAARRTIEGLGPDDRASLILFDAQASAATRPTRDRAALVAALDTARVGSGATRYAPALKLAGGILAASTLARREAVLISDFQKSGWNGAEGARLPAGAVLTPLPVGAARAPNVTVTGVSFRRERITGGAGTSGAAERVTATARLASRGEAAVRGLRVTLELNGRAAETSTLDLAANGAGAVTFAPFILSEPDTRGTVRAAADALPADDAFHFVLSPGQALPVLVLDGPDGTRSLYLRRALSISEPPGFRVAAQPARRFRGPELAGTGVVVLDDAAFPGGEAGRRLEAWVRAGGGLIVVLGEDSRADGMDALLPGRFGAPADGGDGVALGRIDFAHPVFEPFSTPHGGDFSAARFYRRRPVTPADSATVLARFEDGAPALVERSVGRGRVLLWASTLDTFWNDLALQPVFLPFVQGLARYASGRTAPRPWATVGEVVDVSAAGRAGPDPASGSTVLLTPSGGRIPLRGAEAHTVRLAEQGYYEVRAAGAARPAAVLAANLDVAESDLARVDPKELAAAATVPGKAAPAAESAVSGPEERERRQGWWWYLLFAAFAAFAAETLVSNRLSRAGG